MTGRQVLVSAAIGLGALGAALPVAAQDPQVAREGQFVLGGGVSLSNGEETTRGFNATVALVQPLTRRTRLVVDVSKQYSEITSPTDELVNDHSYFGGGVEYDLTKHFTALARSEYEHNYRLGIDTNFTERAGVGLRLADKATKRDFLLALTVSLNDETLSRGDPAEGWQEGFGFFQRASMNVTKRFTFTDRLDFKRQFPKWANELEFQGTGAVLLTRSVGIQVQFNFEYESLLGPSHGTHYEDSTQLGLVYRFGGTSVR